MFKFVVVRNPWDHALAFYTYHHRATNSFGGHYDQDFVTWVLNGMPNHWVKHKGFPKDPMNQLDFFTSRRGDDLVDWVVKFEELNAKMPELCERLEVSNRPLKVANGTATKRDYRASYNDEAREAIASRYPKFIERFDYRFD